MTTSLTPDLTGQVAIVTGASRGIGRAVAESLATFGAHVILAARSAEALHDLAESLRDQGRHVTPIPTDLASEDDIARLFQTVADTHHQLDILINNAGIGAFGPVAEFPTDQLDQVLRINLRGTFLCCRHAIQLMQPRRSGYIINISSVVGFKGYPNQAAYTASKHGIMGLTKSLAVEAQPHHIRVSAILPGGVDTDLVTHARPDLDRSQLLAPQTIAHTIQFLLTLPENAAIDQIYIRRRTSAPF